MKTVTEPIYSGSNIVPLADVQHIEGRGEGNIMVVMKSTTWCKDTDDYNNGIYFPKEEAIRFKAAWCRYRSELESDTLKDLSPQPEEAAP